MSPTPNFDPNDAIIPIGVDYSIADPVLYLVGRLRDEWNAQNTDGEVPRIDFAEVNKEVIFSQGDYIIVYTKNVTTEPVTITYGFVNEDHYFTMDFFSKNDRIHLNKIVEEARRILHSVRKDTFNDNEDANELTGRQWLQWRTFDTSFDKNSKNFYKRSIESVLHWRFRQII